MADAAIMATASIRLSVSGHPKDMGEPVSGKMTTIYAFKNLVVDQTNLWKGWCRGQTRRLHDWRELSVPHQRTSMGVIGVSLDCGLVAWLHSDAYSAGSLQQCRTVCVCSLSLEPLQRTALRFSCP